MNALKIGLELLNNAVKCSTFIVNVSVLYKRLARSAKNKGILQINKISLSIS